MAAWRAAVFVNKRRSIPLANGSAAAALEHFSPRRYRSTCHVNEIIYFENGRHPYSEQGSGEEIV